MRIDILGPVGSGKGIVETFLAKAFEDAGIQTEKSPVEYSIIIRPTKEQLAALIIR